MTSRSTTILILGGSAEAYDLARQLACRPGLRVVTSLAGRTGAPRVPAGEMRLGGFGGAEGLAVWLREQGVAAVVDATHPFAARMGWNAAAGCVAAGVPLLRLDRPAWRAGPGDSWDEVDDFTQAAALVAARARRVLLAVGRQEVAPFAGLAGVWFLIRSVAEPEGLAGFPQAAFLAARGPFTLEGERALLQRHAIDTLVCKNSGGGGAEAKLVAARDLGVRVVMCRRPSRPDLPAVTGVAAALDWLQRF